MSVLEFSGVWRGPLRGMHLRLEAGLHVVLGRPSDGSRALVELAAGAFRPTRGRVTVDGTEPYADPTLRRRIGALFCGEELLPARTLAQSMRRASAFRGHQAPEEILGSLGLEGWAARPLSSLTSGERRSVALAQALATREPALIAACEPLSEIPSIARSRVQERLSTLARQGACVLAVTSSVGDGVSLGGALWLLDPARLLPVPDWPLLLAPGSPAHLLVRTTAPGRLCGRLLKDPAVSGLEWPGQSAPNELSVRGHDAGQLALAIARAGRAENAQIAAISPVLPRLELIRAASAGALQAAYETAYRSARSSGPAATSRPVYGAPSDGGPTKDGR